MDHLGDRRCPVADDSALDCNDDILIVCSLLQFLVGIGVLLDGCDLLDLIAFAALVGVDHIGRRAGYLLPGQRAGGLALFR